MTTTQTRGERTAVPLWGRERIWRRRALLAALLIALGIAGAGLLRAATAPPDLSREAQVERIAASLRCPTCQGLSVADSPSQLAQGMRDIITDQLDNGRSPTEIRDWFVARYGQWILLEPPQTGPAALIWLLPVGVVALGAVVAWHRTRGSGLTDPTAGGHDMRRRGPVWAGLWAAFALVLAAGLATNVAIRGDNDVLTGTDARRPDSRRPHRAAAAIAPAGDRRPARRSAGVAGTGDRAGSARQHGGVAAPLRTRTRSGARRPDRPASRRIGVRSRRSPR